MKKFFILFLMTLSGFAFAGHQTKVLLVQFPTDQYSLDQKALEQLRQVCQFLKEHPDAQVKLTGRTDFDGSINYNIILSRARTTEVADFLAENGYSKSEIDEKWVGEIRPIASNLHEEGKALNRSVEILITIPHFENTSSWLKEKEKEYILIKIINGTSVFCRSKYSKISQFVFWWLKKNSGEFLLLRFCFYP